MKFTFEKIAQNKIILTLLFTVIWYGVRKLKIAMRNWMFLVYSYLFVSLLTINGYTNILLLRFDVTFSTERMKINGIEIKNASSCDAYANDFSWTLIKDFHRLCFRFVSWLNIMHASCRGWCRIQNDNDNELLPIAWVLEISESQYLRQWKVRKNGVSKQQEMTCSQ